MFAEKVRDLGLDRLGQQNTRPIAQDFGELILDVSWLNQLDDVIFGHGISLLRWRSGGVKHPHDMPPSRFPPSPTFSDSSSSSGKTSSGTNGGPESALQFGATFRSRSCFFGDSLENAFEVGSITYR